MTWVITGNANIDATKFLGTQNNQPLIIKTNQFADNSEKVRVNPDGNVGIGKAPASGTPYKLEVAGAINATDYHKDGALLSLSQWDDVPGGITYRDGNVMIRGAVGIGKAPSTNYKLEVAGILNAADYHKGGVPLVASQWADVSGGINYTGGNVGIGTTPDGKLHVSQESSALRFGNEDGSAVLRVENSSPDGLAALDLGNAHKDWRIRVDGTDDNKLKFFEATQITIPLTISTSGHVGIGTMTPTARLDVSGDISIMGKHALRGNDRWLRLNQDGKFPFGVHTPRLFTTGSLNVGGANEWGNPGDGNVIVAGRVSSLGRSATPRTQGWDGGIHTWDVEAEGTMWSQYGYKQGSDARTKTNVTELSGVLDKLRAIRGVSFERTGTSAPAARSAGERNIGVIAQEIEEAFPQLVSEHGDEGHKAVDYSGLTSVLVEAAKELSAENEGLRSRIETLERS
jgi:hypothetical protein